MASNLTRRQESRQPSSTLSRWEPFRALRNLDPFGLMSEMMRFDPFAGLEQGMAPAMAFMPRTDVREKADAYEITVELPGVKQKDIEISCAGNTLTISGEIQDEERDEGDRFHAWERVYGRFTRSFTLPEGADIDKVKAELRDGVLHVMIPKKADVQPKRIPVEASKGREEQEQQAGQQPQERQVKIEKKAA
jgi:HSP20 family protein